MHVWVGGGGGGGGGGEVVAQEAHTPIIFSRVHVSKYIHIPIQISCR